MCKLLFLLLVFKGYYGYITDPFIPFLPLLDGFRKVPGLYEGLVKALFLTGGMALLFNVRVREACLILGVGIMLFLLGSKPAFRNHIFICACIFLLCGITRKQQDPWLLVVQVSLVYFGASLNKMAQSDWWTGQFVHNWLLNGFGNPYYELLHERLPDFLLARLFSWVSMAVEMSVAILLLFKKRWGAAFWIIVFFHAGLYTFTSFRFGHFFEDALIYLLVFSPWPDSPIEVSLPIENNTRSRRLLAFFNWNRQFSLSKEPLQSPHWLQIRFAQKEQANYKALGSLVLFTPATYFLLLIFDHGTQEALEGLLSPGNARKVVYLITLAWLWGAILFYGYHAFKRKFTKADHPRFIR